MIDDELAVFVSPAGRADAAGTQADPFSSVQAGLAKAKADGKRLYVCADGGDFDENLSLDNSLVGVAVWGGFKCDGWRFDATLRATVAPTSGVPLTAKDVYVESSFQYMRFRAPQGVAAGESSIAGFVANSTALSFERVEFIAQEGAKGADGKRNDVTAADLAPLGVDINGRKGVISSAGASFVVTCTRTGETTTAGRGSDSTAPASAGLPPLDTPDPNGGAIGVGTTNCTPGFGGGHHGNPGAAGDSGNGAATWGSLTASGWAPASGGAGDYGRVGQGGGGGAHHNTLAAGGGGAGGCGGVPGGGGGGGGASVALLLHNAPVMLKNVQLTAAKAGDGGAGLVGQEGLAGGAEGVGVHCGGGRGGSGGDGGAGGGGAGGISAGVLHVGTAPTRDGGHILVGQAGAAGPGGAAGGSNTGVAGRASETVPL